MEDFQPDYTLCVDSRKKIHRGVCINKNEHTLCVIHNYTKCLCWIEYICDKRVLDSKNFNTYV